MPRVGFDPTIRVFEEAQTVHALSRPTTVIGSFLLAVWLNIGHNTD
jgi:hypothetical protein